MRLSKKSKNVLRTVNKLSASVFFAVWGMIPVNVLAEVRLVDGVYDPEVAARGFTGIADCSGISCLELNPAFLESDDEYVRSFAAMGTRFNESLYSTLDRWQETKDVFSSDRYRDLLLKGWNLISRQTAKAEVDLGLRVQSFAFSYSPANFGAILFVHDPVLPFGELYNYLFSALRVGYAYRLPVRINALKALTLGASLKHTSATVKRFVFNQIDSQFDQSNTMEGQWVTTRLGVAAVFNTERYLAVSAVVSGIPIYSEPIENMPNTDYFDIQPGLSVELAKVWWGGIRGYYSLSRLTRGESIWLKQHAGLEGAIGKFKTAIGVSDAMLTYGLSLTLPVVKFSFATYGVEYSSLAHNITDRVYWFKVEI